jgi:hypothetical protein
VVITTSASATTAIQWRKRRQAVCVAPINLAPKRLPPRLLAEIKASSNKEPVAIDSVIEVQALVGTSRKEIFSALGEPDACANKAESKCNTQSVWVYSFYRLPKGWRGGGPELNLAFSKEGRIKEAKWKFSR